MPVIDEIRKELLRAGDAGYRAFQSKLLPSVDHKTFIGVRTPDLRRMAKRWGQRPDIGVFLKKIPHACFDENQLHAFIISEIKDYARCVSEVSLFLPYVDNWATCDQLSPKAFKKHRRELIVPVRGWLASGQTYTVRFGVRMLMDHYLDAGFDPEYPAMVAAIRSEEYYVRMMRAWYFATALAKRYDEAILFLTGHRLDDWTHNMTIRKAVESRRITPEKKEYLRSLRVGK